MGERGSLRVTRSRGPGPAQPPSIDSIGGAPGLGQGASTLGAQDMGMSVSRNGDMFMQKPWMPLATYHPVKDRFLLFALPPFLGLFSGEKRGVGSFPEWQFSGRKGPRRPWPLTIPGPPYICLGVKWKKGGSLGVQDGLNGLMMWP